MDGEILLLIIGAVVVIGGAFLLFILPLITKRIKARDQSSGSSQPSGSSLSPVSTLPLSQEIPTDVRTALTGLDVLSSKVRNDQEILITDLKALRIAGDDAREHAIFWIKQADTLKRERARVKNMVEALEKTFDPTNELMSRLKAAVEGE